jgi:hypothetical protein
MRTICIASGLLAFLLLPACHMRPAAFVNDLREYRGDGRIEETTVHSLYSAAPGYRIFLPAIAPDPHAEAVFRLDVLPPTRMRTIEFVVQTEPVIDLKANADKISLSLELRDQNGATVYRHSGITERFVERAVLSPHWNDMTAWRFGARGDFVPQRGQKYTLHMRYSTNDSALNPALTVIVWSGGVF